MAGMIRVLIGAIIARIVVEVVRNRIKNSTNISWVFRTIKMSGLKFELMCKGIALGLIVLFYLLHLMGISKILPYTYTAFIYLEVVVLFIAPLKAEAECCLLIKEVPEEVFGWRHTVYRTRLIEREKEVVFMSSLLETYPMVMIYLRIANYYAYKCFIIYDFIIVSLLIDILVLISIVRDDKRFKRLEAKYYEEKFRSYYRK
ncbi:MAG: hypothetical protein MR361_05475 [Clostridiales bacterium]|nr:hypothetical protein [Clostridiales bacterium]MDD6293058.1 hypothetical protein [Eubacteriales bacterium]